MSVRINEVFLARHHPNGYNDIVRVKGINIPIGVNEENHTLTVMLNKQIVRMNGVTYRPDKKGRRSRRRLRAPEFSKNKTLMFTFVIATQLDPKEGTVKVSVINKFVKSIKMTPQAGNAWVLDGYTAEARRVNTPSRDNVMEASRTNVNRRRG